MPSGSWKYRQESKNIKDFKERELPYVLDIMARYMDARIKFEVEESGFFENNFLAKRASSTETDFLVCMDWLVWQTV